MSDSSLYLWHIVGTPYMVKEGWGGGAKEGGEREGGMREEGREQRREGGKMD